jgi:hypothetical protein
VQAIALEEDRHAGGTDKKESSVSLWRLGRFPRIPFLGRYVVRKCSIACAFEQIDE